MWIFYVKDSYGIKRSDRYVILIILFILNIVGYKNYYTDDFDLGYCDIAPYGIVLICICPGYTFWLHRVRLVIVFFDMFTEKCNYCDAWRIGYMLAVTSRQRESSVFKFNI